jgi:protein-tyrosine-phosphatase
MEAAMNDPIKVLFVCVANSARSQLAEALLRHTDPRFAAFSAGSQPSSVDPRTIAALEYVDVDASGLSSKSIDEFRGEQFDYVITLCDKSARECQAMPGAGEVIAWDFPDPVTSNDPGAFRHTLHDIHERIKLFVLVKTKHLEDV